jgi:peptide/nickel transport system permease protein
VGVFILIVLVIGGFRWMPVARLVRAQFLSLREKEFVEAARALGASTGRQVVRHILPNSAGPGDRGRHHRRGRRHHRRKHAVLPGPGLPARHSHLGPHPVRQQGLPGHRAALGAVPGLAIFLTVLTINFIGDGLRDALDPRKVM